MQGTCQALPEKENKNKNSAFFRMTQFYYISIKDEFGNYVSYVSEKFRISELEIINLIRLLFTERRSRILGLKILEIYRDANEHRKSEIFETLKKLGVNDEPKTEKIPEKSEKR